jgi:hypothetical protein
MQIYPRCGASEKSKVIVKDLPLYKGVGPYGNHGIAPVSKLMS